MNIIDVIAFAMLGFAAATSIVFAAHTAFEMRKWICVRKETKK